MKFIEILNELENKNPGAENNTGRRDVLKKWGTKIAVAAIPFAGITLSSKKSSAKTTEVLAEAIVFALSITRMQIAFYEQATAYTGLILPPMDGSFKEILKQKRQQEAFWVYQLTITSTPVPAAVSYDFTAKGHIPKVFSEYGVCLQVAQALEDVGVRMYLTTVNEFWVNQAFRSNAICMAATNARHAAHVRLRRRNVGVDLMPWVPGTQSNSIYGEVIKAYQEEDVIIQLKNNIVGINGFDISFDSATEAFDEPIQRILAEQFLKGFTV